MLPNLLNKLRKKQPALSLEHIPTTVLPKPIKSMLANARDLEIKYVKTYTDISPTFLWQLVDGKPTLFIPHSMKYMNYYAKDLLVSYSLAIHRNHKRGSLKFNTHNNVIVNDVNLTKSYAEAVMLMEKGFKESGTAKFMDSFAMAIWNKALQDCSTPARNAAIVDFFGGALACR